MKDTGVVPDAYIYKTASDQHHAHLLMEKLEGRCFEQRQNPTEIEKTRFDEVVKAIADATDLIHQKGILIVDINEGTYVLDRVENPDDKIDVKVVDFELAQDMDSLVSFPVKNQLINWYSRDDMGLALVSADRHFLLTKDLSIKAEQYLAAKSIVDYFLGWDESRYIEYSSLSEYDQGRYDAQIAALRPFIETRTKEELFAEYQIKKEEGDPHLPDSEEKYFEQEYPMRLEWRLDEAMTNITLPYLLQEKGVHPDEKTTNYLQRALSPFISERPINGHLLNDSQKTGKDEVQELIAKLRQLGKIAA